MFNGENIGFICGVYFVLFFKQFLEYFNQYVSVQCISSYSDGILKSWRIGIYKILCIFFGFIQIWLLFIGKCYMCENFVFIQYLFVLLIGIYFGWIDY